MGVIFSNAKAKRALMKEYPCFFRKSFGRESVKYILKVLRALGETDKSETVCASY